MGVVSIGNLLVSRVRRTFARNAVVLMYHGVASVDSDPWNLQVNPQHFREQMQIIREQYSPLALPELASSVRESRVRRKGVVVTFDDGYANNLYDALPILEEFDIPATIFVCSGYLNSDREFWWDELEQLIFRPDVLPCQLPEFLTSEISDRQIFSDPTQSAESLIEDARAYQSEDSQEARIRLYRTVWEIVYSLTERDRLDQFKILEEWGGIKSQTRSTHRILNDDELARFADSPLIEIGAHTQTHPDLTKLSPAEQAFEIEGSRRDLEMRLNSKVLSFSYPYGRTNDSAIEQARKAGFSQACATATAIVNKNSPTFALQRYMVQDWDSRQMTNRMTTWFNDSQ